MKLGNNPHGHALGLSRSHDLSDNNARFLENDELLNALRTETTTQ